MSGKPAYAYAAEPRAVPGRRQKYRYYEEGGLNIMADPRVVRGNTYSESFRMRHAGSRKASQPSRGPSNAEGKAARSLRQAMPRGDVFAHKDVEKPRQRIDLSAYLVEQAKRPETYDVETTIDPFLPLPPPEPYIPAKTGVDVETQISSSDELFQFDEEVKPLLDVLISKSVEQAKLELEHTAELAAIDADLSAYQDAVEDEKRAIGQLETSIIERAKAKAKALRERKEEATRRRDQAEQLAMAIYENRLHVEASALKKYLKSLEDPVADEVMAKFLPYLVDEVATQSERVADADELLDGALHDALGKGEVASRHSAGTWRQELARRQELEAKKRRKGTISVKVAGAALGLSEETKEDDAEEEEEDAKEGDGNQEPQEPSVVVVGPLAVAGLETVEEVEKRIQRWITDNVPGGQWPVGLLAASLGGQLRPDSYFLDAELPEDGQLVVQSHSVLDDQISPADPSEAE
uniref:Radial spoke protein 3 n=1 Tax=Pinguiococcus pyrenoidosus TaxID=172671 RepID=A0A7R9UC15_9STRA|mmetsp:Transcript_5001/g.19989  ORF Transcript_5001/g.19989 Transcript_5001/m.19989 type:complete len:466 (+) Transcript_5001:190-1587(+)